MREVYAKSIINKHRRDPWFLDEYSVNPYLSCEFGCVYCYTRGGRYGASGPVAAKVNAPSLLRRELARLAAKGKYGFIALGSATEPWMWAEERYEITRACLRAIARYRFPVHCLTKSTLILRDVDLLLEINQTAVLPPDLREEPGCGVLVTFSISTLDEEVARLFEPGAPSPAERLRALARLRDEGITAGVAYIPILPYISDSRSQLEEMVVAVKEHGACYLFFSHLTLPGGCKESFYAVLKSHFPSLPEKYARLFRGDWKPGRWYTNSLLRSAIQLCKKHRVKMGIAGRLHQP